MLPILYSHPKILNVAQTCVLASLWLKSPFQVLFRFDIISQHLSLIGLIVSQSIRAFSSLLFCRYIIKKVLFQVKASKLITLKCCRGIFKFWMKYYKDGGSGGRSSRSLKRCQISIRSNCPPAGITLKYSTTQIYTFSFQNYALGPQPRICSLQGGRSEKISDLSLISSMFPDSLPVEVGNV